MNIQDTAEAAHRVASTAMYGGATVAAGSGASMGVVRYLGFTPAEWQVIGVLGGLAIGVLGLVANAAMNFYFKTQELRLLRERLEASDEAGD